VVQKNDVYNNADSPEAWYKAVRHIMEFGNVVDTEYGLKARQILMGTIEIDKPSFGWHKGDPFCTKARVEEYKKQFDRAYLHQHHFEYTYLERLVEGHGIDQLAWIQEQLLKKRLDRSAFRQSRGFLKLIVLRKKTNLVFNEFGCTSI